MDSKAVSFVLLAGAAGFVIGNIGTGLAAERLGRRGVPPLVVAGFGMGTFMLLQVLVLLEWTAFPATLWFLVGAFGASGVLVFSVLAQTFSSDLAGRANTAQNLLIFAMAFALQWGMGEIINIWPVTAEAATHGLAIRRPSGSRWPCRPLRFSGCCTGGRGNSALVQA